MPNKKYLVGRRFEWKIKKLCEKAGYEMIRSAGSKSPFDLIAIDPDVHSIHFIQCKKSKLGDKAKQKLKTAMFSKLGAVDGDEFSVYCEVITSRCLGTQSDSKEQSQIARRESPKHESEG